MPDDCIFCKIANKQIPVEPVYANSEFIAFRDQHPQAPVHVLVIPKGAYVSFADFSAKATDAELAHFFRVTGQIARDLGVEESGYRLVANHGPDSRGEVPHFHIHIIGKRTLGAIC